MWNPSSEMMLENDLYYKQQKQVTNMTQIYFIYQTV